MKLKILLLIITFAFLSCEESSKHRFQKILDQTITHENLIHYDYVVIIPQEGCEGCITFAEDFYNTHNNLSNILYIFTNILSEKSLKQRVNLTSTTIIDKANNFTSAYPDKQRLYPCLLTLEKGTIQTVDYQSPDGNALIDLEELIDNN